MKRKKEDVLDTVRAGLYSPAAIAYKYLSRGVDVVYSTAETYMKTKFGKEYAFGKGSSSAVRKVVIDQFLRMYDPKFNQHVQLNPDGEVIGLNPGVFLLRPHPIEKDPLYIEVVAPVLEVHKEPQDDSDIVRYIVSGNQFRVVLTDGKWALIQPIGAPSVATYGWITLTNDAMEQEYHLVTQIAFGHNKRKYRKYGFPKLERSVMELDQDNPYSKDIPKSWHTFIYVASGYKETGGDYQHDDSDGSNIPFKMFIFGRDAAVLCGILDKMIKDRYVTDSLGIFNVDENRDRYGSSRDENTESLDIRYSQLQPREMNTLFFSNGEMDEIISHLNRFESQRSFYEDHQLLYKTGILMYGIGGVGKSSAVKAIATKYNRDILNINVSHLNNIDLVRLSQAIALDNYRKYIVLLEDVDTLFLNRDRVKKEDENGETSEVVLKSNAIINKLLQFLDSNSSPTDVIFVATTNHVERLDPALLRPGRFDLHVNMRELNEEDARRFCKHFEIEDPAIDRILSEYIQWCEETGYNYKDDTGKKTYNQSAIQMRVINSINNKDWSVDIIDTSEEIAKEIEKEQQKKSAESSNDKGAVNKMMSFFGE